MSDSHNQPRLFLGAFAGCLCATALIGCANPSAVAGGVGGTSIVGSSGRSDTGGNSVMGFGGAPGSGGFSGRGGGNTGMGGVPTSGGTPGSGGSAGAGGAPDTGDSAGGAPGSGGALGSGGRSITDSSSASHGSGGTPGIGGFASSGGTPGIGGFASSGGAPGIGGFASSGGAPGSGGTLGSAGLTAGGGASSAGSPSGGALGSGGLTGRGGTSDAGGPTSGGASSTCPSAKVSTGGTQYCASTTGNVGGNYAYELWASGGGTGCMTVYGVAATFSATWTSVGDFLARIGLGFDQTKTPAQIGTISADFAETKTNDSGLVYVGIYGWSVNPLREYYIIEDWGTSKPAGVASDGSLRTSMGTITVDGDTYDVWKNTRTDKPAITGDHKTFDQYFSVRQTARQCGHISISSHFSQWAGLGLQLGNLEEAKLLIEAQNSTGSINFTTATVVVK